MIENSQVFTPSETVVRCECLKCKNKCRHDITYLNWKNFDEPLYYPYICEDCVRDHYVLDDDENLVVRGDHHG